MTGRAVRPGGQGDDHLHDVATRQKRGKGAVQHGTPGQPQEWFVHTSHAHAQAGRRHEQRHSGAGQGIPSGGSMPRAAESKRVYVL